jgi:parvulin-like peptidyl-prolyl isomerase
MHWWDSMRDPGSKVPESPQSFIEWKLLVQEAISMELDLELNLQSKLQTFYKARTRVLLKNDAVDKKIQITDDELKAKYEALYSPIWQINLLYFDSEKKAQSAFNGMQNETYSYAELEQFSGDEGGPIQRKKGNFRPKNFKNNIELLEAVKDLSVGEMTQPHTLGNYYVLLYLEDRQVPEPSEFESRKMMIREIIWKEKQGKLTIQLINELKKKFEVQVDEKLLAKADIDLSGEILNNPVVTTNVEDIPLAIIVKDMRKEYRMRRSKKVWSDAEKQNLIRGLLNGIIAEYLLTWEARDRHYEDQPPFKWIYEFYKENRLIKEVERRLIAPQVKVEEKEISTYYEDRIDQFRPPEILSFLMLFGDREKIERAGPDIKNGQDFEAIGEKYELSFNPIYNISARRVAAGVRQKVDTLEPGKISQPFEMNGEYYVVQLQDRKIQNPVPMEKVRDKIISSLKKEKFVKLRQEYLEMVLDQSEVSVNRRAWNKLSKKLTDQQEMTR